MDARSIAVIATFAALAIALNTIRIPTVYWPGWFYTFGDIPVLVAFLIYGFKVGFLVEVLHIAGQEIFFPVGAGGIAVYPMGLVVIPLMVLGIYLATRFITRRPALESQIGEKKKTVYLTGLAVAIRGGVMPIVDYSVLYHVLLPLVLDRALPEAYIAAIVPLSIVYNVTSTLYAVPAAYFIAKQASKHLRLEARLLSARL
jgi:riboflavin transporter FmnP